MPSVLRIVLAVVAGLLAGSAVNMGLIGLGGQLVPPPAGADLRTAEGWKAAQPLLGARHFVFPFLAHALGTLAGAAVAAGVTGAVPRSQRIAAGVVGVVFLAGGIAAAVMIPAPGWFVAADLLLAYLPMAWVGQRLVARWGGSAR